MQRIAKQDQELKEFIGKTEDVLLQSETQVQYCQEDIRSLEERLLLWSSTLEQIEDITPRNTESSMSQTEASGRVSRNKSINEMKCKNKIYVICVCLHIVGV
jgi:hypothetical protein